MCWFNGLIITIIIFSTQLYAWDIESYKIEAHKIMEKMSLEEKIGQIVLPSYRLLAAGEWFNNTQNEPVVGFNCQQLALQHLPNNSNQSLIKSCGLDEISRYQLGAVYPDAKYSPFFLNNTPDILYWQKLAALSQVAYKKTRAYRLYHLPLLLGTDAIHGDSHVAGAVILPHNINLGVTHSFQIVKKLGQQAGLAIRASGFNWTFAPTVALAKDYRWGRSYESFGGENKLVHHLSKAYITGLQEAGVLATAKHFIGDGGTDLGQDEGDLTTKRSLVAFWKKHGAGYEGAGEAGVGSIMASYSAVNGERIHLGTQWNLINQFKSGTINSAVIPFSGFVVSDYTAISRSLYYYNQAHPQESLTFVQAVAYALHAGVDMIMAGRWNPYDPFHAGNLQDYYYHHLLTGTEFREKSLLVQIKEAVLKNIISLQDINNAVDRIVAVKLALAHQPNIMQYNNKKAKKIALQAAEQSLILLKNKNKVLPIKEKKITNIVLLDNQLSPAKLSDANDIGLQNGGWSITWQGQKGNDFFNHTPFFNWKRTSGASTIYSELKARFPKATFYSRHLSSEQLKQLKPNNTLVIAVLAEPPYAEFMGDVGNDNPWFLQGMKSKSNLYTPVCIDPADWSSCRQPEAVRLTFSLSLTKIIKQLKKKQLKLITVIYSGRPLVLTEKTVLGTSPWGASQAIVAAFLPGTLGGKAIVNALLGDYRFRSQCSSLGCSNTLNFPWPFQQKDIIKHFVGVKFNRKKPPFNYGYGLAT